MSPDPTRVDFPSAGGVTIAAYRWDPAGGPSAIAQLVHGAGEHSLRYAHVAEALSAAGYVVYAHDHRGHGATAASVAEHGVLGESGWGELLADIGRTGALAREAHPGLPLALVAHSLGSFASQQYLLDHSAGFDAVVLSGTASLDLLEPMVDLEVPMDLAMFNAAFQPPRTDFDWLSRDDAEVDAYIADPLCGFGLDIPGGKAMFVGARQLADPARVAAIRSDLPVSIIVGDMDPVNGSLALVNVLVDRLKEAGLTDVTLTVYPGARHEVFNETNRDQVIAEMVAWIDQALAARAPA